MGKNPISDNENMKLQDGLCTAFIDSLLKSNLAYKWQFVYNFVSFVIGIYVSDDGIRNCRL